MPRTVLVISDLHLGGAPDFQMCSPEGRTLLAGFLGWTARRAAAGEDIHLVVNGDLVDCSWRFGTATHRFSSR